VADWSAALTVRAAERGRVLTPLLRVDGRASIASGTARVELVDEQGVVRRTSRRPLPARSLRRRMRMPCVKLPAGVTAAELTRWAWDVVVEDGGRELVRWRRFLMRQPSLNTEAELAFSGSRDPRRAKEEAEGRGPEAVWNELDSERLLAVLVDEGDLGERDRDDVLARRALTGTTVERTLIEGRWVDEEELLRLYAELTGSEFLDLSRCTIDPRAASRLPEDLCLHYGMIAIGFRGEDLLTVAMSDPQHPRAALEVEAASWLRAYIAVATRADVLNALENTLLRSLGAA
jgi:hypothetical protein